MSEELLEPIDLTVTEHPTVKRLVNRFEFLLEINASINSTIDIKALLRKIIDVAAVAMNAEASSLALVDQTTQDLTFHLAEGVAGKTVESMRIKMGQGIAGWVAEHGEHVIVNDVASDTRFYRGIDNASKFQTRSIICVPLKRTGKVIGVLQALNKKDGEVFDDDDLSLFLSLANIAAIAIENSQLYQLLKQTLKQLQEDNDRLNKILDQLESSEAEVQRMKSQMTDSSGMLMGSLEVFVPANVLQMLGNDMKTGLLVLENEIGTGHIYMDGGRIYHADLNGPPQLTGSPAIYQMMDWNTGKFSFRDKEKTEQQTTTDSCMHLIIEGLRRSDECKLLLQECPPESIPHVIETAADLNDVLSDIDRHVMILLTPDKSLDAAWKSSTFDQHTFYTSVTTLLAKKLLTLTK